MRTKEKTTKERIKDILEAENLWYCMPATGGYGRSGNFDFIINVDGAFLGVEAKRDDKEKPTQLQTDNAMAAWERGATVLLIHKDNLHLLQRAITSLRARMRAFPRPVNYLLNDWPAYKPAENDTNVKLIRKKQ